RLAAFDAEAESARFLPPQRGLHQDEKVSRATALLEKGFLGVAAIGLICHVLCADLVGFAAVHLDSRDPRQQLSFFGQQSLLVGSRRSLWHYSRPPLRLNRDQSILWMSDGDCQPSPPFFLPPLAVGLGSPAPRASSCGLEGSP